MKPASCFRDSAGFSNRQKRLQQNRRYAVKIHNGTILETRLLLALLVKPTNVPLLSTANPPPVPPITAILCSISMKKTRILSYERTYFLDPLIDPNAVFVVTTADPPEKLSWPRGGTALNNPNPVFRLLEICLEPGPLEMASGMTPMTKANEVIRIGRKRWAAACFAASTRFIPFSKFSFANSTIRIAFFAESPIVVRRPT